MQCKTNDEENKWYMASVMGKNGSLESIRIKDIQFGNK